MLASSTHDTKRSEDVRARINVLSEIPAEWYRAIRTWQRLNEEKKIQVAGEKRAQRERRIFPVSDSTGRLAADRRWTAPGARTSSAGSIPTWRKPCVRRKSIPAGSIPNTEYEAAVHSFPRRHSGRFGRQAFSRSVAPFQARIARAGIFNSLSQTLLKITAPGLPDFYQGTEVWNFSLADPDNRRPVDYDRLQALLAQLHAAESDDPAALVDRLVAEPGGRQSEALCDPLRAAFPPGTSRIVCQGKLSAFARRRRKEQARDCFRPLLPRRPPSSCWPGGSLLSWAWIVDVRWVQTPGEMRKSSCASSFLPALIATCLPGKTVSPVAAETENPSCRSPAAFAHLPIAMLVNVESRSRAKPMPSSPTERSWELQFGASVRDDDTVEFRVWAPNLTNLAVRVILGRTPAHDSHEAVLNSEDSEFAATVPQVGEGADYFYVLEGERERPDPVSRWQPHGVHGPSRIVDPASFHWSDQGWSGIPLKDFIIYEFHTGTFTREGTFESVIPRLPYLRDLGITAIEIMPVAEVPGNRNWGYDGASLYAPQSSYGGPDRAEEAGGRLPPARAGGRAGRGLQPPWPRRKLSSRVCSLFHRHPSHALGKGDQL